MSKKREKELKEDAVFWFEGLKLHGRLKLNEVKRARELEDDPVRWTVSCDCGCENETSQSLSRSLFGFDLF